MRLIIAHLLIRMIGSLFCMWVAIYNVCNNNYERAMFFMVFAVFFNTLKLLTVDK